jgi:cell division protein FtsI/penicillin-binding protein 2
MITRALVATILLVVASGCALLDRAPDPQSVADAYVADLRSGSITRTALRHSGEHPAAAAQLADLTDALGSGPRVGVIRTIQVDEGAQRTNDTRPALPSAEARLRVSWDLPRGTWAYDSTLPLVLVDGEWKVDWSPAILHPHLTAGRSLRLHTTAPERGPILSAAGEPLFEQRPVVTVYVQRRRTRSARQVAVAAHRLLGVDRAPLEARVAAADPDELVEVITLRVDDYAPLRSQLQPVPGLVFRRGDLPLTPYRAFGRALLGRLGRPTAEVLDEAPSWFDADDVLGLSGLQRGFQDALAGTPGFDVVVVDADDEVVETLHRTPPVPGDALRTTLDMDVQRAADGALTAISRPAALVAVQASTGPLLAVANGPGGGASNLAFSGRYPPGSTFKVVSGIALLSAGARPDTSVACPRSTNVGGRTFRNADGLDLGATTLRRAFARSCNTTFARLAPRMRGDALTTTARALGFGGSWNPGVYAYTGQVPPAADPVEQAATALGQADVLASPLLMASVAAAVQDGTWRPPVLLPDHATSEATPSRIDPGALRSMRTMMRAVVTKGTAAALADVPGPPVRAKTGTAEFGGGRRPPTHAWVIAARDDVAVAVLVVAGGAGAQVAVPAAARFFAAL